MNGKISKIKVVSASEVMVPKGYSRLFSNSFCSILENSEDNSPLVYISSTFDPNITSYIPVYKLLEDQSNANRNIRIVINSRGGSVVYGCGLIDKIEKAKKKLGIKVTTEVVSLAASMGALLWCCGDEMIIDDISIVMFHSIQMFTSGHLKQIGDNVSDFSKIFDRYFNRLIEDGLFTSEEIRDIYAGKEFWLTGKDIKERIEQKD